jgi:hypothetical protein
MILGEMTDMPEHACLNCGSINDALSAIAEEKVKPSPGDATICIKCGHLMIFDDNLQVRNPTSEELIELAGDIRLVATMTALDEMKKENQS